MAGQVRRRSPHGESSGLLLLLLHCCPCCCCCAMPLMLRVEESKIPSSSSSSLVHCICAHRCARGQSAAGPVWHAVAVIADRPCTAPELLPQPAVLSWHILLPCCLRPPRAAHSSTPCHMPSGGAALVPALQPARTRKERVALVCKRIASLLLAHWSKAAILGVLITLIVLVSVKVGGQTVKGQAGCWVAQWLGGLPAWHATGQHGVLVRTLSGHGQSCGSDQPCKPTSASAVHAAGWRSFIVLPSYSIPLPPNTPLRCPSTLRILLCPTPAGFWLLWGHPCLVPAAQWMGRLGHFCRCAP